MRCWSSISFLSNAEDPAVAVVSRVCVLLQAGDGLARRIRRSGQSGRARTGARRQERAPAGPRAFGFVTSPFHRIHTRCSYALGHDSYNDSTEKIAPKRRFS